jgi:hypothetical protein
MVRLVGQNDVGDAVLVAVLRVGRRLHHDAGGEDDALEVPEARQNPLGLGGGALVPGIKAKGAVHDGAKSGFRDLPADGVPFSSSLPPTTVKLCQNLRRACGPSTTVNSQSSMRASLDCDAFRSPASAGVAPFKPPGRMVSRTLAKVPSGISSPMGAICGWASFRS